MRSSSHEKLIIGRFGAPFGVKGWIKVISYASPIDNILKYRPWLIHLKNEWQEVTIEKGQSHGKIIIIKLSGCNDRNKAQTYTHKEIAIRSIQLPPTASHEYYWADLIGLTVFNKKEIKLGVVDKIMATGANDVLVVKSPDKTILIPFIKTAILEINLEKQQIRVDWEIDW